MTNTPLGPGAEFDAIREMLARLGANADGIGDDAAVLSIPPMERLVVSTDTSVDGVHFKREWLRPDEIGWRATMAALSDLAAMGARPLGVLSACVVPPDWRDALSSIADGVGMAAAAAGCRVIGGDLSAGREFSVCVTVLGAARSTLSRSGARAGDAVFVTGRLGGPALALRAWLSGAEPANDHRARFAHPEARIRAGAWLAGHGCTAAVDISDGLVADAGHIAVASRLAMTIELDAVPCVHGAQPTDAAAGGEEYELLACGPASLDTAAFEAACGIPLTRIGGVAKGTAGVTATHGGARVEFTGGYDHFSA